MYLSFTAPDGEGGESRVRLDSPIQKCYRSITSRGETGPVIWTYAFAFMKDSRPARFSSRWLCAAGWRLILVLAAITYGNSLQGGFHLDDYYRIVGNPGIHQPDLLKHFALRLITFRPATSDS